MRLSPICATGLLAGASILALISTPAMAQQATPGDPAAPTTTPGNDANLQDADQGNDIIVTASKRETTLQDTPIAVSVTTQATIEQAQVRDLIDIQTLIPSLRVSQLQSSANTNFIIRGFGNGANNPGIEPSVGVFIDGVYRSRSAAQIGDLPNLRRVEVLRGPQSTLFGKNASAGIISIVTAEPSFHFGGTAELSYGNYNAFVAKGSVTGPITDTVAFSLAGNYNRRDGYAYDARLGTNVNNRNRFGFRGQLLWQPTDALKVRLIGDFDRLDENVLRRGQRDQWSDRRDHQCARRGHRDRPSAAVLVPCLRKLPAGKQHRQLRFLGSGRLHVRQPVADIDHRLSRSAGQDELGCGFQRCRSDWALQPGSGDQHVYAGTAAGIGFRRADQLPARWLLFQREDQPGRPTPLRHPVSPLW